MRGIVDWVKEHLWESASAVLGLALVVALVVLLTSLGDSGDVATSSTTSTTGPPVATTEATSTTSSDDGVVTTTVPQPSDVAGPVAVVVDNVADVGFQVGIGEADLLIETPVEGGLTRFTAFYGDQLPGLVGPVRSLRPVCADVLALFDPVVFTTGGQPFVTGAVASTGTVIVTPSQSIAFQSLERPQPHHVFVSPEVDISEATNLIMPWDTGPWAGGRSVSEVTLPSPAGDSWRFEGGMWVRYRGDEAQQVLTTIDSEPSPLTRATLVIMMVNEKSAGYTDSNGVDVPTFDVIGGGSLFVLHDGEVIDGTWFRASQDEGYEFTDGDGQVIPVPEGAVYLGLVPDDLVPGFSS